jgi:hypothetical protein
LSGRFTSEKRVSSVEPFRSLALIEPTILLSESTTGKPDTLYKKKKMMMVMVTSMMVGQ